MTLVHLLKLATRGYPERLLANYFAKDGSEADPGYSSDTLAQLIVIELRETYRSNISDLAQIDEAVRVLNMAKRDIEGVINILTHAATNRQNRTPRRRK